MDSTAWSDRDFLVREETACLFILREILKMYCTTRTVREAQMYAVHNHTSVLVEFSPAALL